MAKLRPLWARILVLATAAFLLLAAPLVRNLLIAWEDAQVDVSLERQFDTIVRRLTTGLNERTNELDRVSRDWVALSDVPTAEFEKRAAVLMAGHPELIAVALVDSEGGIRHAAPEKFFASVERAHRLALERPKKAFERSTASGIRQFSEPIEAAASGKVFLGYFPIRRSQQAPEALLGVFHLGMALDQVAKEEVRPGYYFELLDGYKSILKKGTVDRSRPRASRVFTYIDTDWKMDLQAPLEEALQMRSRWPTIVFYGMLAAGIGLLLLTAYQVLLSRQISAEPPQDYNPPVKTASQAAAQMETVPFGAPRRNRMAQWATMIGESDNPALVIEPAAALDAAPPIVYVNPAFERLTGYSLAVISGKTMRSLQSLKADRAPFDEIKRCQREKQPFSGPLTIQRSDGTLCNVQGRLQTVQEPNEPVAGWILTLVPVEQPAAVAPKVEVPQPEPETVASEPVVVASDEQPAPLPETRLLAAPATPAAAPVVSSSNLLSVAPIAAQICDESGRVSFWNHAAEELFGWTRDEVLGHHSPVLPPNFLANWASSANGTGRLEAELHREKRDGTPIELSVWARRRDNTPDSSWLVFFVDISERSRRLQETKTKADAADRYRSLFESAGDLVILVSAQGELQYSSPHAEEAFGLTAERFDERPIFEAIHEADREPLREAFHQVAGKGGSQSRLARLNDLQGRERTLDATIKPSGVGDLLLLVGFDITDRQTQHSEQLQALKQELNRVQQALGAKTQEHEQEIGQWKQRLLEMQANVEEAAMHAAEAVHQMEGQVADVQAAKSALEAAAAEREKGVLAEAAEHRAALEAEARQHAEELASQLEAVRAQAREQVASVEARFAEATERESASRRQAFEQLASMDQRRREAESQLAEKVAAVAALTVAAAERESAVSRQAHAQVSALQSQLLEATERESASDQRRLELESQLAAKAAEIAALTAAAAERESTVTTQAQEQIAALQSQLSEADRRCQTLEAQLAETAERESASRRQAFDQLAASDQRRQELESQLAAKAAEIAALTAAAAERQSTVSAQAQEQVSALQTQLSEATEQRRAAESRLDEVIERESASDQRRQELESQLAAKAAEIAALTAAAAERESTVTTQAQEQIAALQSQLSEADRRCQTLEAQLAETAERESASRRQAFDQLAASDQRRQELESQLAAKAAEIAALTAAAGDRESTLTTQAHAQISDLQSQLAETGRQRQALETQLAAADQHRQELASQLAVRADEVAALTAAAADRESTLTTQAHAQISSLQSQLAEASQQRQTLEAQLAAADQHRQELETQLAAKAAEAAAIAAAADRESTLTTQAHAQISDLQSQLAEAGQQRQLLEAQLAAAGQRRQELESQLAGKAAEAAAMAAAAAEREQAARDQADGQRRLLQTQLAAMESEIAAVAASVAATIADKEAQLAREIETRNRLEQELGNIRSQLSEAQSTQATLNASIEEQTSARAEAEQHLAEQSALVETVRRQLVQELDTLQSAVRFEQAAREQSAERERQITTHLAVLQADRDRLRQELAERESANQAAAESRAAVREAEEKREGLERELREQAAHQTQLEKRIEELESALSQEAAAREDAIHAARDLEVSWREADRDARAVHQKELAELEERLNSEAQARSAAEARLNQLSQQIVDLAAQQEANAREQSRRLAELEAALARENADRMDAAAREQALTVQLVSLAQLRDEVERTVADQAQTILKLQSASPVTAPPEPAPPAPVVPASVDPLSDPHLLDEVQDAVTLWDTNFCVVAMNLAAQRIFGVESWSGRPVEDLVRGWWQDPPFEDLRQKLEAERRWSGECRLRRPDGQRLFLEIVVTSRRAPDGTIIGYVAVLRDLSKRKSDEEALRASEERYALAARSTNDGLFDWNLLTEEIYYSPRWKQMLGYGEQDILGNPEEWFMLIHPADIASLKAQIARHLKGLSEVLETEYRIRRKDGSYVWMETRAQAVRDDKGRTVRMVGSQSDISEQKAVEDQLLHEAFHDALTGLPNRTLFLDRLGVLIDRARHGKNPKPFAVLFLDLDRFKYVNDSLGHLAGDLLLIETAHRLQAVITENDTVARYGGDEFTILVDNVPGPWAVQTLCEKLQRVLAQPITFEGQEVYTSVSVGSTHSSLGYERPLEMLRDADTALYQAKERGRARHVAFDRAMHTEARARLQLEGDLRRALEREEFQVVYLPMVALGLGPQQGRLAGFEALVRWNHPQRGQLTPGDFLPAAEDTGLILDIDRWVLRQACIQMRDWHQRFGELGPLHVSVNLSGQHFSQLDLAQQVRRVLEQTQLSPEFLRIELTERVLMKSPAVTDIFRELNELKVQLNIDDFGTSASSLAYLTRFPIDRLKIDRSFVTTLNGSGRSNELIRGLLQLAHQLKINVVAEGVETQEQLELLRRYGCEFAQGYYFARPLDALMAEELIGSGKRW